MAALGLDLGWETTWGGTALHHAAWHGKVEIVRCLIELGAPIAARDSRFGTSPLSWAAHGSHHHRRPESDYVATAAALLDAAMVVGASLDRVPEEMAIPAVAEVIRKRADSGLFAG